MTSEKKTTRDRVTIPATFIPEFRTQIAIQGRVEKNLLFKTWGGIGDQICAEPTLRYALKNYTDCKISLAADNPELFSHLQFEKVFDLKESQPIWEKYYVMQTIVPATDLTWQFFSHLYTHCVDFSSLCALRSQLPVKDREIQLEGREPELGIANMLDSDFRPIFIHPGKHWPSKTFPKDFWDAVIHRLIERGCMPVIIGADADENRGTVDVDTTRCTDLRNMTSISETIWLLKRAKVLLTNDSAPLHMAASGSAWIGFIATCKHPDFITHRRNDSWGWRMQNFGKGGAWDLMNSCPNKEHESSVEFIDEPILRSWLPDSNEFADWAVERAQQGV